MEATAEVYNGGRITIPIKIRKALNVSDGEKLTFLLEDGELKILTLQQQLDEARRILKQSPAWDRLSVDEFLQERRLEAKRELEEYNNISPESAVK